MTPLTLADARKIVESALAGGRTSSDRHIAVAVCDAGGHPLALDREETAAPLLAHIAQAKAFTCVVYGKATQTVAEWAEGSPFWFHGVSRVAQTQMGAPLIGSKGGVFVRDQDGNALGAVGIAGEAGHRDESLACEAIEAAGFVADAG